MSATPTPPAAPEHNVTGVDFSDRGHFRYAGPLIDIHAHVMITRPGEPRDAPPTGKGPGASIAQAETLIPILLVGPEPVVTARAWRRLHQTAT